MGHTNHWMNMSIANFPHLILRRLTRGRCGEGMSFLPTLGNFNSWACLICTASPEPPQKSHLTSFLQGRCIFVCVCVCVCVCVHARRVGKTGSVAPLHSFFYFFKKLINLIYLFLAALGLCCCMPAFSSCSEWRLLFIVVCGLLIAVASPVEGHGF